MPFTLILGRYHIRGDKPDGDSIRFGALNNDDWNRLSGPPAGVNVRGHVQLRLEGIDTLEAHFRGAQQPPALALKALDFLLKQLAIKQAQFNAIMTVVTEANEEGRLNNK